MTATAMREPGVVNRLAGALGDVSALTGRRLLHLRRNPGKLFAVALNPLVMVIALGYLFEQSIMVSDDADYKEYVFAGVVAQIGLTSIGPTAIGMAEDLRNGLFDRFRSLSIPRWAVLTGHSIADLLTCIVALAGVVLVSLLLGWRPHTSAPSVLAGFGLVIAFYYVMLWVGMLMGLAMRNLGSIESAGSLVLVVFTFVSNAFLSTERMPGWLGTVAEWNPLSCLAHAARELWGNPVAAGTGLPGDHALAVTVIMLGAILAVAVPLAVRAYHRAAHR